MPKRWFSKLESHAIPAAVVDEETKFSMELGWVSKSSVSEADDGWSSAETGIEVRKVQHCDGRHRFWPAGRALGQKHFEVLYRANHPTLNLLPP